MVGVSTRFSSRGSGRSLIAGVLVFVQTVVIARTKTRWGLMTGHRSGVLPGNYVFVHVPRSREQPACEPPPPALIPFVGFQGAKHRD